MRTKDHYIRLASLVPVFLIGLAFTSCDKEHPEPTETTHPVTKESYYDLSDTSLYKSIEYFYNSDNKLTSRVDKHYHDTLSNKTTEFFYDLNGNLTLTISRQIGWTDDNAPIEVERKTKFAYSSGQLVSETVFVDSAGRGFDQKKYYYTNDKIDSIQHYSYSVRQDLEQLTTEYFYYKGGLLVEKGYDKKGSKWNTKYEYSNGLLTKEFNHYRLTTYEYKGRQLKRQKTTSGNQPNEYIEYFYNGNKMVKKVVSRFSVYSENPNEPYAKIEVSFEY